MAISSCRTCAALISILGIPFFFCCSNHLSHLRRFEGWYSDYRSSTQQQKNTHSSGSGSNVDETDLHSRINMFSLDDIQAAITSTGKGVHWTSGTVLARGNMLCFSQPHHPFSSSLSTFHSFLTSFGLKLFAFRPPKRGRPCIRCPKQAMGRWERCGRPGPARYRTTSKFQQSCRRSKPLRTTVWWQVLWLSILLERIWSAAIKGTG